MASKSVFKRGMPVLERSSFCCDEKRGEATRLGLVVGNVLAAV